MFSFCAVFIAGPAAKSSFLLQQQEKKPAVLLQQQKEHLVLSRLAKEQSHCRCSEGKVQQ